MTPEAEEELRGARVLLSEIVRRAAFDWVLYRSSRRLKNRQLAREAYVWLFEEGPGHIDWEPRCRQGWYLFSFLSICETLGLQPSKVREAVRQIRTSDILASGRPATRNRQVHGGGLGVYEMEISLPFLQLPEPTNTWLDTELV